jgi:hypothetical protein
MKSSSFGGPFRLFMIYEHSIELVGRTSLRWSHEPLSLAPGFSRVVEQRDGMTSRFNGLPRKPETVETVPNTA